MMARIPSDRYLAVVMIERRATNAWAWARLRKQPLISCLRPIMRRSPPVPWGGIVEGASWSRNGLLESAASGRSRNSSEERVK